MATAQSTGKVRPTRNRPVDRRSKLKATATSPKALHKTNRSPTQGSQRCAHCVWHHNRSPHGERRRLGSGLLGGDSPDLGSFK